MPITGGRRVSIQDTSGACTYAYAGNLPNGNEANQEPDKPRFQVRIALPASVPAM